MKNKGRDAHKLTVGLTHPYKSVEDKINAIDNMTEAEAKEVLKVLVKSWYKKSWQALQIMR